MQGFRLRTGFSPRWTLSRDKSIWLRPPPVLLTDTVGFIQKLPTQLVAAFRATLEELDDADVLLHMIDITHPAADQQRETVEQTLTELGLTEKPRLELLNKVDRLADAGRAPGGRLGRTQ